MGEGGAGKDSLLPEEWNQGNFKRKTLSGSGLALLSDPEKHGEQSSDIHRGISLFNSGQFSAWAVQELLWMAPRGGRSEVEKH
ncbi:hypothetical protein PAXINDRAFT_104105 [Paxillus involutus ATCC 200175]|uniref:Uncharacterized protein n=1 Tax=Paxillus involutus ATCC 200175 TaxID=664439 RepID=A0A0C9SZN6_PAXIN|nr:hypothetical protein PAXINDRAFT_104105 [Paxillus involutus ATCC 200175]